MPRSAETEKIKAWFDAEYVVGTNRERSVQTWQRLITEKFGTTISLKTIRRYSQSVGEDDAQPSSTSKRARTNPRGEEKTKKKHVITDSDTNSSERYCYMCKADKVRLHRCTGIQCDNDACDKCIKEKAFING